MSLNSQFLCLFKLEWAVEGTMLRPICLDGTLLIQAAVFGRGKGLNVLEPCMWLASYSKSTSRCRLLDVFIFSLFFDTFFVHIVSQFICLYILELYFFGLNITSFPQRFFDFLFGVVPQRSCYFHFIPFLDNKIFLSTPFWGPPTFTLSQLHFFLLFRY